MRLPWLTAVMALSLLGCNEGLKKFRTAKTSGQVLCDGEPVANVRVYFQPVGTPGQLESGKVGGGHAAKDGKFVISTYGEADGAVVGSHNVIVDAPHPEDFRDFQCNCETHSNKPVQQVEVVAGSNYVTIDLPPKKGKSKPNKDLEDILAKEQAEAKEAGSAKPGP